MVVVSASFFHYGGAVVVAFLLAGNLCGLGLCYLLLQSRSRLLCRNWIFASSKVGILSRLQVQCMEVRLYSLG